MTSTHVPDAEEILSAATVVALPMRTRFRGQTQREVMLIQGPQGWAEFGPFPEYGPEESSAWLASAVEAGWEGWGAPLRREIPVNATMPAVPPEEVETVLARYGSVIPAVKIKVAEPGQSTADDVARVEQVHRLAPDALLRVDANAAWSVDQAVPALEALAEAAGGSLEYAEQPVPGVESMARLRQALDQAGIPVPLAADEAIRRSADPLRVAALGAADLMVIKAAPLGGVRRALELVRRAGLPAVVSSALDTSVGLSAGLALAAHLPQLPHACGLGTVTLFHSDVVEAPLVPRSGAIPVPLDAQGSAERIRPPRPSPELLRRYQVIGERRRWWDQRLRAAHRHVMAHHPAVPE